MNETKHLISKNYLFHSWMLVLMCKVLGLIHCTHQKRASKRTLYNLLLVQNDHHRQTLHELLHPTLLLEKTAHCCAGVLMHSTSASVVLDEY